MRRPLGLWMLWRMSLCTLLMVLFPLVHQSQETAAGDTQPAQAKPKDDASGGNSGHKLSGLAVVIKAASVAGDSLFYADGYRIRVGTGTVTAFSDPLKTLADVAPGTWIRFEGTREDIGILVARKAEFFPPGTRKVLTSMGPRKAPHAPDYQPVTRDGLLDADGHFFKAHTKVRYSDGAGPCGWHKVHAELALQERVERIGMRIVPAFQKQLPLKSQDRIPFRFYVVADDKVRAVFACNAGLVLVPKNVVERLQNDDQLAAVLADGVAYQLERQLVTVSALDLAVAAGYFIEIPAGYIAGQIIEGIAGHEREARLQREVARMALQLLDEAGFDPWQGPEAWRILAPKDTPVDIQSLKYTREGEYQLGILKVEYKKTRTRG